MKNFIILAGLGLIITACTVSQPIKQGKAPEPIAIKEIPSEFMSDEEIVEGINEKSLGIAPQYTDPDIAKRIDGLIPDESFTSKLPKLTRDLTIKYTHKSIGAESNGVDNREYDTPVKSQNNGLCTAYATVGSIEGTLCKTKALCGQDLSEQHLFKLQGRVYDTTTAVETAETNLIADEIYWKQYESPVGNVNALGHAKIVKAKYLGTEAQAAMDAMDRGSFVVMGMKTPNDMLNCRATIRTTTTFAGGGHALLVSGYKINKNIPGGMYAIIKNSWGKDCGDKGYQYVPLNDICNKNGSYCFYYEIVGAYSNKVDSVDPPSEPELQPEWNLLCEKRTWRFWSWSKKDRCKWKCTKNCSTVCNGAETCYKDY